MWRVGWKEIYQAVPTMAEAVHDGVLNQKGVLGRKQ